MEFDLKENRDLKIFSTTRGQNAQKKSRFL